MNIRKNYIYKNILQSDKGFAISSIMYLILILAVVLMTISLAILSNRHLLIVKQKDKALEDIYGNQEVGVYVDSTLNGSDPVLGDLTPVVYKGSKWVIADNTTTWYDYEHQEWANAVILNNTAKKKVVGQSLDLENDVIAMFVWIPRYEYKIEGQYGTHTNGKAGTEELPGEIKINFISSNKKVATDGYIIHPAFWWDNDSDGNREAGEELSGIWVGKFETTGTEESPTILPNLQSLTNQNISTQFSTSRLFETKYGISFDSHMSKNSEWGATAYLSQSKYGKYGNINYTEANKEVYHNNSSGRYTGRSSGRPTADGYSENGTCTYDDIMDRGEGKGQCGGGASTTGNITGVYDMNGGTYDRVMANYIANKSDSGFSDMPASKYYDKYETLDPTTACNGGICYGHALSETSGWYSDLVDFVDSSNPWFERGGNYDDYFPPGVFYFGHNRGHAADLHGFRLVLVVT